MQRPKTSSSDRQVARLVGMGLATLSSTIAATTLLVATPSSANAQAAYGSYIGLGGSFGLTPGKNDHNQFAGDLAVRYKFLKAPVSLRTQVLVGESTAVVPTVSYDIPINWQADAYVGIGASIVTNHNKNTPVGNRTTFVVQPGVDYALPNSNWVVFGNAIIAFDAYDDVDNRTAVSLQGGLGLRF
ncbi:hypothetical protein [Pantanalinema sp. GBBB05]|uniref:hypothetical protein n=1 Tax=Pantanalinema sp. GBBB05 TaxID=2604139 RepID=UPI003D815C28